MNKKRTIVLTLLLTTITTLFGCNSTTISNASSTNLSTSTSDSNINDIVLEINCDTEDTSMNNVSKNTTIEYNDSTNLKPTNTTSTQKEVSIVTQNNTAMQNTISKTEGTVTVKKEPVTYKSQAGYSLIFPGDWNGKYTVQDDNEMLSVIFKSVESERIDYTPWIFKIEKFDPDDDYSYIREFSHFFVGDEEYIAYGPTSVTLNDDIKDYDKYFQMSDKEVETIVNSIVVNI